MLIINDLDGNILIGYELQEINNPKRGYKVNLHAVKQYTFLVNAMTSDEAITLAHKVYQDNAHKKISNAATFQAI